MNISKIIIAGGACLAAAFAAMPVQAEPAFANRAVSVRAGPGLNYQVVDKLVVNEPVDRSNCNTDGSWCYIRHEGTDGWVAAVFLSSATSGSGQTPSQPPQSPPSDQYQAKTATNVRTGPGTGFAVVGSLKSDETVTRGQCSADGNWCYITHDGPNGWVSAGLLRPADATPPAGGGSDTGQTGTDATGTFVATAAVNLRSGPGTGFRVLDQLNQGEQVTRNQCSPDGNWCYVTHDGPDGWVSANYLQPARSSQTGSRGGGQRTQPATTRTATATTGMPVRSGPSLFTGMVGRLERGETIPLANCTDDGNWCHVVRPGLDGWVPAGFIQITDLPSAPAPRPSAPSVEVKTTAASALREGPGEQYRIVGMVPADQTVQLERCTRSGDWCQINRSGVSGWMSARVLEMPQATAPDPAQPQAPNSICFNGPGGVKLCIGE